MQGIRKRAAPYGHAAVVLLFYCASLRESQNYNQQALLCLSGSPTKEEIHRARR